MELPYTIPYVHYTSDGQQPTKLVAWESVGAPVLHKICNADVPSTAAHRYNYEGDVVLAFAASSFQEAENTASQDITVTQTNLSVTKFVSSVFTLKIKLPTIYWIAIRVQTKSSCLDNLLSKPPGLL